MTHDPAEPTPFRAGHRGNADRLRSPLPGGRVVADSAPHHYLSPACHHEFTATDAAAAAALHAHCAGTPGPHGPAPRACPWCGAPCGCPGHGSKVDGPAVDDQLGDPVT